MIEVKFEHPALECISVCISMQYVFIQCIGVLELNVLNERTNIIGKVAVGSCVTRLRVG